MLEDLVDFLGLERVSRHVTVPLIHLGLDNAQYDLGGFGILQRIEERPADGVPKEILQSILSIPLCTLTFMIQTKLFLNAQHFPLGDLLRSRIAVLRLAVDPFISYNHFNVEHVRPWEIRLHDHDFHSRFWAQGASEGRISTRQFTNTHAEVIKKIDANFQDMKGDTVTPWTLALNRLDDAVFKLETASPDAILDLVIGLESLFVEPDNRQESAHKVATRLARFLEETEGGRRTVFRQAKELYKLRSKLAHGQAWALDEKALEPVETAARLLSRSLHKMMESRRSDFDHLALDLM